MQRVVAIIITIISKLKNRKASGPDQIKNKVLKELKDTFATLLGLVSFDLSAAGNFP